MADRIRSFVVALIVVPALFLAMSGLARAATLTVTNTNDRVPVVCEMKFLPPYPAILSTSASAARSRLAAPFPPSQST
jgi:hypothetical protein